MKKKDKMKVNIICSGLILLLGIFLFSATFLENMKPNLLLYVLFSVYAGIKMIEFILTKEKDDRESLYTSIACILVAVSGYKFGTYDTPKVLGITLFSWVGIMAIIKLIKLDYYHDRNDGMFYVNLMTFSLFILLGLLTSINLYYDQSVQLLLLAFFFVVNGILSLAETGINYLVKRNKFKSFKI